jgi:dUTP pyrophosphatase
MNVIKQYFTNLFDRWFFPEPTEGEHTMTDEPSDAVMTNFEDLITAFAEHEKNPSPANNLNKMNTDLESSINGSDIIDTETQTDIQTMTKSSDISGNVADMVLLDELGASNDNDTLDTMGDIMDMVEQFGHAPVTTEASGEHGKIDLSIKRLPHLGDLPLPKYQSKLASGFDIYAAIDSPIFLNSIGASAIIDTGISIAVPVGFEAQVRPRSGLAAKHGITVTNTPGTIDADYRGEIKVILVNLGGRRFTVERGMRIAQVVICPVVQANMIEVDDHDQTERGDGAHGSTGVY